MATILVSIGEYLATSYRPDREYIDGTIEERNLGEYDHARLQAALVVWFFTREREWSIRAVPELRVQVSPTRFRVPDVTVIDRAQPVEQILTQPPLIVLEVLSPEDTLRKLENRINDYLDFGVEHIWIVDPLGPKAWTATRGQLIDSGPRLEVPGTPIYLALAELAL